MSAPDNSASLGALVVLGAGGVVCSKAIADRALVESRWAFVAILAGWSVLWLLGTLAARRSPTRPALVLLGLLAVAMRLAAIAPVPSISDDAYRYVWDGRVQAEGIDPYRHHPIDRAVSHLRDDFLWPSDEGCRAIGREPGCTRLNRPNVRTIYPPVAEAWFLGLHLAVPHPDDLRHVQVASLAVDLACGALILASLRRRKADVRLVAAWALSPLAVVELVGNAHVDGLALLFLLAAALAADRERHGVAGALVGLAALVKLYPGIALVAVLGRTWPSRLRAIAGAAAVVVLGYLPHVLAVGWKVLGYLPGYLREERYDRGGRFLLVPVPSSLPVVAGGIAVGLLAVALVAIAFRGRDAARSAAGAVGGLVLAATPVQPWYAAVAGGLGAAGGLWWWAVVGMVAEPYYAAVVLDATWAAWAGRAAYAVAAVVVVLGWLHRKPEGAER